MASSIPEARTSLVEALQAQTGSGEALENVAVARTGIWQERRQNDRIEVLNARSIEREPRLGGQQFAEEYILPVRVTAIRGGDDLEQVETRAWALVSIVEQTVLSNNRLGGAVSYCNPAGAEDEVSGPSENNTVVAEVTLNIAVGARPRLDVS